MKWAWATKKIKGSPESCCQLTFDPLTETKTVKVSYTRKVSQKRAFTPRHAADVCISGELL